MADLQNLCQGDAKDDPGLKSNYNVDYVVDFKIPNARADAAQRAEAEASFVQLVEAVARVGFATEVRAGADPTSLLLFTRLASDRLLTDQVYHSRVQDWLYGVRVAAPAQDLQVHFEEEPVTEAERLRLAFLLLTKPRSEGGAGITPGAKKGRWRFISSVFPLHDHAFNHDWIKRWSTKYFLDEADLGEIRDHFGEQVAFYFAFLQAYFTFLLFPAAFGFGAWMLLGRFSWVYVVVNCLWSIVFVEHWKLKEVDLAVRWGVRGVSQIQHPRPEFQFEREVTDPVTGEAVKVYSPFKRLARQLLQVPFALACLVILGGLIAACFGIEIFITEVYNGPFKQYLTFLPTILLTICIPTLSTLLTSLAKGLTELENYETQDAHRAAFVQKMFVINFVTSYMPIFLTAFVYVPFGKILVPHLSIFKFTTTNFTAGGKPLPTKEWAINPHRLTQQVVYFTVTAQVVNFLTETIMPYAKRRVFKAVQGEMGVKKGQHLSDNPEEKAFLERVQNEAELGVYDITVDYREMVIQFGYLCLISVIWPLTACSFLVNNWVEARGDAMKIAISSQRPIPWRADSIGPWLDSLGFLAWMGSVTSAAIVYLFGGASEIDGTPNGISAWALLLAILFAEHVYLMVQAVVRNVIGKLDSPGLQKERAERFALKKQFLEQTFGPGILDPVAQQTSIRVKEKISREALEEDAGPISSLWPVQRFWQRQRGTDETIQIGRKLIAELLTDPPKVNKTTGAA